MKISQIAICVPDQDFSKEKFKEIFGTEMYTDKLKMKGTILGENAKDVPLELSFDHEIMDGVELEYITSQSNLHWHAEKLKNNGGQPFLSHLGVYCKDIKQINIYVDLLRLLGYDIIQKTTSYDHSNKRESDDQSGESSRTYMDVIVSTEKSIGFNLKFTTKV